MLGMYIERISASHFFVCQNLAGFDVRAAIPTNGSQWTGAEAVGAGKLIKLNQDVPIPEASNRKL